MSGHPFGQSGPPGRGPLRLPQRILVALVPVLTLGLLGMVPSVLLAVRRRRAADVLCAVVAGLVQLTVYVALGLTPSGSQETTTASTVGGMCLLALWLGAPVHYLAADTPRFWFGPAAPVPVAWPGAGHPAPGHPTLVPGAGHPAPGHPTLVPGAGHPAPGHPTLVPAPAVPVPAPAPVPAPPQAAPNDDLQQLGELLRRQAGDGRR
ncbi:hypothetical protein [Kitasatospora sp. NPDC059571]|uniref:hypothetical protein n=1 Tax=Kitasatospora sp. NPDC059571 TaxID=3346871 RepID=UPI003680CC61